MGGSLGLAIRSSNPSIRVIGVDQPGILETALKRGAISEGHQTMSDAVCDADITFIATPPAASLNVLKNIALRVKSGSIVSDMSSVKCPIEKIAGQSLPDDVLFVGGHPMTGSEKVGIRYADALLFENATYVLCPGPIADGLNNIYSRFTSLLSSTGARLLEMDAQKHDRIAARVSHVPQLLSVLLVNLASRSRKTDPELLDLAAGGFRDMTRIASSPFPMWKDILDGNRHEILQALKSFEKSLSGLRQNISSLNFEAIRECFRDAEHARDFISVDRKGFLHPLADVYVVTSDRPGALVDITGALFRAELSIKDIELLRIREGTGGTFRIGFDTSPEADSAVEVLSNNGFSAYRL